MNAENTTQQLQKTRYSQDELKEFETIILKKLEKARQELESLKISIQESSGADLSSSIEESSAAVEQQEQLNGLFSRQYKFIKHLENALYRIKMGTYGLCKVTNKLIAKSRLMVVPHTQHSVEAKQMRKKNISNEHTLR